ncbi:MAG: class I SAM-dependent DNA methyltransferase [Oscillospiraceae bacterium]
MAGYGLFAQVYDQLTENVPYDEIAAYYDRKIKQYGGGNFLADIGCGTGNLTARLAGLGYDVIGADASPDMLAIAMNKPHEGVQYICQPMTELELYGEADVIVSTLDSVNHLADSAEIQRCFETVALNLREGGLFLFDVNTIYKHKNVLAENTFVYDVDGVYCVWQNHFVPRDNGVDIELDIFAECEDGLYERMEESFREIALPQERLASMLESAGFEVLEVTEYLTDALPQENSEKLMFCARKIHKNIVR